MAGKLIDFRNYQSYLSNIIEHMLKRQRKIGTNKNLWEKSILHDKFRNFTHFFFIRGQIGDASVDFDRWILFRGKSLGA